MADENLVPKYRPDRYLFLRQRTSLDLLSLDEEVQQIAVLVQDASECAAFANEFREAAKDALTVCYAATAAKVRSNATGKKTEGQIDSEVHLDEDHIKAMDVYGEARLDASLWTTLVEAFRTKSMALRTAADLISSGYLTSNMILDKRREQIRKVVPRQQINRKEGD